MSVPLLHHSNAKSFSQPIVGIFVERHYLLPSNAKFLF